MDCTYQVSLSFTISWTLFKLMSVEPVVPSNLCRPLLLLPSVFPSITVFSIESALDIRGLKYWGFSFSISPSNEYSGLISFRKGLLWSPCCPRDSQVSSAYLGWVGDCIQLPKVIPCLVWDSLQAEDRIILWPLIGCVFVKCQKTRKKKKTWCKIQHSYSFWLSLSWGKKATTTGSTYLTFSDIWHCIFSLVKGNLKKKRLLGYSLWVFDKQPGIAHTSPGLSKWNTFGNRSGDILCVLSLKMEWVLEIWYPSFGVIMREFSPF